MDPTNLASAVWAFGSALGVAALGTVSILGRNSRPHGALAFGLLGLVWALEIIAGNLLRFPRDPVVVARIAFAFVAAHFLMTYLLVAFAGAFSTSPAARRRWRLAEMLGMLIALVGALLVVFAPNLLLSGFYTSGTGTYPLWGPLYVPLVITPQYLAFAAAFAALYRAWMFSPTRRTRAHAFLLASGLGLYVGFAAWNNAAFFILDLANHPAAAGDVLLIAVFLLLSVMTLVIGAHAWRSAAANGAEDGKQRRILALLLLGSAAWGIVEAVVALRTEAWFETVGLWRLAGVAVIAYGLARWRFYDLPQKTRRAAASAGGATLAVAGGAAVYGAGALLAASTLVPVVLGLVAFGAALVPSVQLARRVVQQREGPPHVLERQLYGQRIDTYRAAIESAIARGTLEEDEPFLAALRERFRISDAEDRVLRYYAQSSVVVARPGHAWDAYERLRLLGEGGAGRTWLARDRGHDRLVVLKEPLERWQKDPTLRESVLREARLASKVRHPNVVRVEQVLEHGGSPILVMEYLEGGTLLDVLRARGALPWREAVPLVAEVLRGLEAVHAAGVTHRDIKPANILLTAEGSPKIGDFGIALPTSAGKTLVDASGIGRAGTFSYLPPEARTQGFRTDRNADLYACAALLHELLHGAPPSTEHAVVVQPELPPGLARVLAKGLATRPEERYQTARAFHDDLMRVISP